MQILIIGFLRRVPSNYNVYYLLCVGNLQVLYDKPFSIITVERLLLNRREFKKLNSLLIITKELC